MEIFFYRLSIIFFFGLFVGSFLNCVIYRLETKQSFLRGRSFCPYCKHKLSWRDLIPVFSFLFLRGRCRYCGKKISWQYPLVELATGVLFILIFWHLGFGFDLTLGFWILLTCFLIIIFVYDLKHYIIPDKVIYPAIAISFFYVLIFQRTLFFNFFLSALGAGLFFFLIYLISQGKWLGFGDVKLAFLMGLFLGFPKILPALFLSFFIGAIIGVGLVLAKKKGLKSEVPFGPFLVTGTFLSLFWGLPLIKFYLKILL